MATAIQPYPIQTASGSATAYYADVISNLPQPDGSLVSTLTFYDSGMNTLVTRQQSSLSAPAFLALQNSGANYNDPPTLLSAMGLTTP